MSDREATIPVYYAKLIVRYTHNLLSEAETNALDAWLEKDDRHIEHFEELIDDVHEKIFSVDDLIIETDELLDLWMITGLIARNMEGILSPLEKKALKQWLKESARHQELYRHLCDKAKLHQIVQWLKDQWNQQRSAGLN